MRIFINGNCPAAIAIRVSLRTSDIRISSILPEYEIELKELYEYKDSLIEIEVGEGKLETNILRELNRAGVHRVTLNRNSKDQKALIIFSEQLEEKIEQAVVNTILKITKR